MTHLPRTVCRLMRSYICVCVPTTSNGHYVSKDRFENLAISKDRYSERYFSEDGELKKNQKSDLKQKR